MISLQNLQKISAIDEESITSTYEGHTIFSIFWDQITVYETILIQQQESEFPKEVGQDGRDYENAKLRRLFHILNMPTSDLIHNKKTKA